MGRGDLVFLRQFGKLGHSSRQSSSEIFLLHTQLWGNMESGNSDSFPELLGVSSFPPGEQLGLPGDILQAAKNIISLRCLSLGTLKWLRASSASPWVEKLAMFSSVSLFLLQLLSKNVVIWFGTKNEYQILNISIVKICFLWHLIPLSEVLVY